VEPPSTRPWLGVGAALSALCAAGACLSIALVLAVIADSDPGGAYQQHRWLGAVVAASASCAYVAMMGWATLRHGGLPAPVLLIALVLAGAPFLAPGVLFLPAAVVAVAGCAALATVGLRNPPASPDGTRTAATVLTGAAVLLVVAQAVAVDQVGSTRAPRAEVLSEKKASSRAEPGGREAARAPTHEKPPARPGGKDAARAPAGKPKAEEPAPAAAPEEPVAAPPASAPADLPILSAPLNAVEGTPAPAPDDDAPATVSPAAARGFVRDYYAALSARDFATAWKMLSPGVQRAFGGFGAWRKGYANTVAFAPSDVEVAGATVDLKLLAGDRPGCGFAITWRLARTDAGLRATGARGRRIGGPEPC
jgi:hypothetical protein